MGDEQDTWFKPFGFDPGKAASDAWAAAKAKEAELEQATRAKAAALEAGAKKFIEDPVGTVVEGGKKVIQKVEDEGKKIVEGGKKIIQNAEEGGKKIVGAVAGSSGGGSVSSLSGSVGAGGKNDPNDVMAVQTALGIGVDGKCGQGTIGAIIAFQKKIGMAKSDGRIDPGGATAKALAGGGGGGAGGAAAGGAKEDDSDILGGLKSLGGKIVDGISDVGGTIADGAKGVLGGGAPDLGGQALDDAGGGASSFLPSFLKPDSIGGEVTFAEKTLAEKELGKYFKLAVKVGGSIKFSGSPAGPNKPSKVDIEKGVVEFVESMFAEAVANAKFEKGAGLKFNPKDKQVSLGGAVALKTTLGPLTIEFVTVEVSLANIDAKEGFTGPRISVGTSRSLGGKGTVKGVELEIAVAASLSAELKPNYVGIAADAAKNLLEGGAEDAILVSIDAAALAGLPLAVAAIVGIQIFGAGEKAARDAAILEGADDTVKAAFAYAFTITGNPGSGTGPRAKAAVDVANAQLAKIAAGRKVSLEAMMKEMRDDKNAGRDLIKFHEQARQRFYPAYLGEVRGVIKAWRKDHNVLAIFTTEEDDFTAVSKMVAVKFEK
jgi:hypothetical protein